MMFCFLYLIGNLTYVFQAAVLHETTTQYRMYPNHRYMNPYYKVDL